MVVRSATASDAIWHELMLARTEKPERPLVVSMSDLAASGGYYIALGGDAIVAALGGKQPDRIIHAGGGRLVNIVVR